MIVKHWMIVDYSGNARLVKMEPAKLAGTEVALEVVLKIPERVTRRRNAISIELPDLHPEVEQVNVQLGEEPVAEAMGEGEPV